MSSPTIALLRDFREEGWPSMDLCADMLRDQLLLDGRLEVREHDPRFRKRAQGIPLLGTKLARNADRVFNRYFDYPRQLAKLRQSCELFHVVDHSYSQLVLSLPSERTGVFVHDLDTFRCLLEPERDPRSRWYQKLVRSTLRGLTQAALVFHTTAAVRDEIMRFALVPEERLVLAPLGVAAEFTPEPEPEPEPQPQPESLGESADPPALAEPAEPTPEQASAAASPAEVRDPGYILHVGSCIPRKRVDVLLRTFAALRTQIPGLRLVKVGGPWTAEHTALIASEGLSDAIEVQQDLSRAQLADLYRGARLVLHPSDAEGFGLPVLEALACGAVVVASEIPAHVEVGGSALVLCPPGDVAAWVRVCAALLRGELDPPARAGRLHHARRWSWSEHARQVADAYLRLL